MSRYDQPCTHYIGAEDRTCGAAPTRRYLQGHRCIDHRPLDANGRPAPKPPAERTLDGIRAAKGMRTTTPPRSQSLLLDDLAVASGKRRATPARQREARQRLTK